MSWRRQEQNGAGLEATRYLTNGRQIVRCQGARGWARHPLDSQVVEFRVSRAMGVIKQAVGHISVLSRGPRPCAQTMFCHLGQLWICFSSNSSPQKQVASLWTNTDLRNLYPSLPLTSYGLLAWISVCSSGHRGYQCFSVWANVSLQGGNGWKGKNEKVYSLVRFHECQPMTQARLIDLIWSRVKIGNKVKDTLSLTAHQP